jgi:hypothetical protein
MWHHVLATTSEEKRTGYYMRYIVTDNRQVSLNVLETALRASDQRYSIKRSEGESGELRHDDVLYGTIEVNAPPDQLFSAEVEELLEEVNGAEAGAKETVIDALKAARAIITIQVLWGDRTAEETLMKLDPLWDWLKANRKGLSQADGEGYYEARNLILRIE